MDQPRSDSAIASQPSTTAYRPARAGRGAETVINPERRGASLPLPEGSGLPSSSVWLRLFPSEVDYQDPALVPAPAGLQLGHFQIEARIGAGGMGAVFHAMDTRLQRAVALKILSPSLSRDETAVQRFQNEARAVARLDHENIARVHFIGEEQGLYFIAFEFITGVNLRELIRERSRIEPNEAVNFVLQIASALRHTSTNGVVHRDIKPSNIIITPSGRAKLVDLGLARKESTESTPDLTMVGTTLGTFDYISPEQAKDPRNVDVRSDIYSLGCTLYHMLTGEPPFPDGTVLKKLLDHQSGEPPDPAKKNRRVSDDLSLVCRKMMASDPKRRYQTPDQLIHDLMLIAGSLGLRGISPEGLIWLNSNRSMSDFWRQNVGVIAMAALLIVIVVGIGWFPKFASDWSNGTHAASPTKLAANDLDATSANRSSVAANSANVSKVSANNSGKVLDDEDAVTASKLPVKPADLSGNPSRFPMPLLPGFENPPDGSSFSPLTSVVRPPDSVLFATGDTGTSGVGSNSKSAEREASAVAKTTASRSVVVVPRDSHPTTDKPVTTIEETNGVFVLAPDGSAAKRFPTLEAACAAVADGSVIELRYNGRRSEKPLRVSKKNVTIRAARGFHPIVEFALGSVTPDAHLRLIGVSSGPVHINNVAFEVSIPPFLTADRISLFAIDRAEKLRLQDVAITLSNPGQRPTALFDISTEAGQMLADMKMNTTGVARDPLEIELTECFVRGHCDLFHVRNAKPGRLLLRDTAIALDGSLLRVEGHSEKPAEQTRLELRLEHVTAIVGQSLIRLDSGDLPRELPPVKVEALNNILITTSSSSLVTMSGNTSEADFRKLFVWSGEKNFYDGFEDWKTIGDVGASNEKLFWLADRDDAGTMSLDAMTLDRNAASPNPGVNAATDGNNAGADISKLPRPVESEQRAE
ncbi:MAG: serine/threonine protein kinase [Planctomycetota bacterium]|nr:MAG: serine/threonine protein kinase [Planctomycetota bacterium]